VSAPPRALAAGDPLAALKREAVARAHCVTAQAEIDLAARDLAYDQAELAAAAVVLRRHGDAANSLLALRCCAASSPIAWSRGHLGRRRAVARHLGRRRERAAARRSRNGRRARAARATPRQRRVGPGNERQRSVFLRRRLQRQSPHHPPPPILTRPTPPRGLANPCCERVQRLVAIESSIQIFNRKSGRSEARDFGFQIWKRFLPSLPRLLLARPKNARSVLPLAFQASRLPVNLSKNAATEIAPRARDPSPGALQGAVIASRMLARGAAASKATARPELCTPSWAKSGWSGGAHGWGAICR
jgi:hypothetical protein